MLIQGDMGLTQSKKLVKVIILICANGLCIECKKKFASTSITDFCEKFLHVESLAIPLLCGIVEFIVPCYYEQRSNDGLVPDCEPPLLLHAANEDEQSSLVQ